MTPRVQDMLLLLFLLLFFGAVAADVLVYIGAIHL